MFEPARSESTGQPGMTGEKDRTLESIPPVRLQKIAAEDRAKDAGEDGPKDEVSLHRGPLSETVHACKEACAGAVYDMQHWNELPSKTAWDKLQMVATRGGRLPYLVLTVVVGFLAFFLFLHVGRWFMGSSDQGIGQINTGAVKMSGGNAAGVVMPSVGPSAAMPPQGAAAAVLPNLIPNYG